jgi:hypothetical protein
VEVPAAAWSGALFEKFPHRDVFIADKVGPVKDIGRVAGG